MAGPGIALRLHAFKEPSCPNAAAPNRVTRQGRDTLGLYPGQLGRVHVAPSSNHRVRFASVEFRSGALQENREERYPESFDLQTLRALQLARETSGSPHGRSTATSHQAAFGSLSCLYPPGDRFKFTPVSHPGPLKRTDPSAIRKQPAEGGL
ncbi:hypothetical protein ANANG_G00049970 [Anguilla anguilla]|uniref:Uncharacterized protein n=1 Tax=Anguilla anguilla TaxID=7936 RepID=A0A9D3MUY8_ANGAN|nr:hypothetical protein ANANG_G00049970 [Anguilla anguilla]